MDDRAFLREAYEQALKSYREGGLPIGAVMVGHGAVVAGVTIAVCNLAIRSRTARWTASDRRAGEDGYDTVTLYTTLSPCMMCTGTVLQFGVKRVMVGEDRNFPGNIDLLRAHGVSVVLMDDADCLELMARFIKEHPEVWDEDIAGRTSV